MDALLTTTTVVGSPTGFPVWDFAVENGIVPIIYDGRQDEQQAGVAAFTNLGMIPQLPEAGVDWTGALTGDTSFNALDSQITTAIANCGLNYSPNYSILNGGLKTTINKAGA